MGSSSSSNAGANASPPERKKHEGGHGYHIPENEDFTGPDFATRKSTDCLWFLFILAHWVALTILAITAFQKGDPNLLIHGMDYTGEVCGSGDGVGLAPYVYFPNPQGDAAGCIFPIIGGSGDGLSESEARGTCAPSLFAICVKHCPGAEANYTMFTNATEIVADDDGIETVVDRQSTLEWIAYPTEAWGYYCLPSVEAIALDGDALSGDSSDMMKWIEELFADLYTARTPIMVSAFPVAVVIGFIYLGLMRLPFIMGIMVWGSVAGVFAMFYGLGAIALDNAKSMAAYDDDSADNSNTILATKVIGYTLWGCGALWLCVICFLCKRIMLAMGVIKEGCRAVGDMKAIVLFPLLQAAALVVFMCAWMAYALFVASAGEKETYNDGADDDGMEYTTYAITQNQEYAGWYMLFSLFWTMAFISAAGEIVIACAVAVWYFTLDEQKAEKIGSGTVSDALRTTFRRHLGTAAFGAFIIAVVRFLRAIVMYLERKCKGFVGKDGVAAKIAKAILCCIGCCLWCLEKCLKFINRNAYIQTGIFGYSFCKAAEEAFHLILRNFARIGALHIIGSFIFLVGKAFISLGAGLACYVWLTKGGYTDDVSSCVYPALFCTGLAYQTATVFVGVVDMAADTVLQCFIADEEMLPAAKKGQVPKFAGAAFGQHIHAHPHTEAEGQHLAAAETPAADAAAQAVATGQAPNMV